MGLGQPLEANELVDVDVQVNPSFGRHCILLASATGPSRRSGSFLGTRPESTAATVSIGLDWADWYHSWSAGGVVKAPTRLFGPTLGWCSTSVEWPCPTVGPGQ